MAKVTSKLQLTVPKAIADQYGIRPGDELDWVAAGEIIRVIPRNRSGRQEKARSVQERLRLFDQATERQRKRQAKQHTPKEPSDRGWKREDLYTRGRPR